MSTEVEIGVWVDGTQKWVTGVTRRTLCHDVIKALLRSQSLPAEDCDVTNYVIVERWRKVERPLDHEQRILKVWKTWGEAIQEVRFTLRRARREDAGSDCETASRAERRKRHKSRGSNAGPPAKKITKENDKISDTVDRLMRLVLAQGETIQTQLKRLQEREQQIENYEQQMHLLRVQNLGSDYLLHSYLRDPPTDQGQASPSDAKDDITSEEKSNDSGVVTEETIDSQEMPKTLKVTFADQKPCSELEDLQLKVEHLEKFEQTLNRLIEKEENLFKLEASFLDTQASELLQLEEELESAARIHSQTVSHARQNEQHLRELDVILYKKRSTLESLTKEENTIQEDKLQLQSRLDYIMHLPPSAFKSLKVQVSGDIVKIPCTSDKPETDQKPQIKNIASELIKKSSVKESLPPVKKLLKDDPPPPLPSSSPPPLDDEKDSDLCSPSSSSNSSTASDSPQKLKPILSKKIVGSSKDNDGADTNSDTGLSSLHSSSDEGVYTLDTLV